MYRRLLKKNYIFLATLLHLITIQNPSYGLEDKHEHFYETSYKKVLIAATPLPADLINMTYMYYGDPVWHPSNEDESENSIKGYLNAVIPGKGDNYALVDDAMNNILYSITTKKQFKKVLDKDKAFGTSEDINAAHYLVDKNILLVKGFRSLYCCNFDSELLTFSESAIVCPNVSKFFPSPDSTIVACVKNKEDKHKNNETSLVDIDTRKEQPINLSNGCPIGWMSEKPLRLIVRNFYADADRKEDSDTLSIVKIDGAKPKILTSHNLGFRILDKYNNNPPIHNNIIALSTSSGEIRLYDISKGSTIRTLAASEKIKSALSWDPSGEFLCAWTCNKMSPITPSLFIWNTKTTKSQKLTVPYGGLKKSRQFFVSPRLLLSNILTEVTSYQLETLEFRL